LKRPLVVVSRILTTNNMNVSILKTTSDIAEASTRLLLYPTCGSSSLSYQQTTIPWMWMTVAGLLGYKVCANAVQLYQFCIEWNLISRSHRVELAALHFFQQNFMTRKIQIMKSLTTTEFVSGTTRRPEVPSDNYTQQTVVDLAMPTNNREDLELKENHVQLSSECDNSNKRRQRSDGLQLESTKPSCPICLGDFRDREQISHARSADLCKHVFHTSCLQAWLHKNDSCPVCRYKMVPSPPHSSSCSSQFVNLPTFTASSSFPDPHA
jgi:hypothetical protein